MLELWWRKRRHIFHRIWKYDFHRSHISKCSHFFTTCIRLEDRKQMVQSFSNWSKALDPILIAWSDLCPCVRVIMNPDVCTIEKKLFWKNSCHLHKTKTNSVLTHVALKIFTLGIWCVFGFLFSLCLSIPLSPKALCRKTSPEKLVTLLNNKWWWKY